MSVKKVSGTDGWRVRWWEGWRPRKLDFPDEADAKAFQKEVRQRRRVTILRVLTLLLALLAGVVGVILLLDMRHREPVAAAFTRVGGATRVETAIEASRFWFASAPKFVVTVRQDADPQLIWRAAWCAVAHDAPLLFTPTRANRERLITNTLDSWPSHPTELKVPDSEGSDCRAPARVRPPKRLRTLNVASASVLRKRVTPSDELKPVVVFAAAKTPNAAPDVAVGLALAAHMARERDVSLVVVPRYLQADRDLEDALRGRDEVIEDGVVLGQSGILSEDVRALLRQVIASSNRKGLLGEVRTTLGSLGSVIAALLALLGLGAAARAATELAQERVGRTPPTAERLADTPLGRTVMETRDRIRRKAEGKARDGGSQVQERPQIDLPTDRALTVQLRSGARVTGIYNGYADLDMVPFLKLEDASLEEAAWDVLRAATASVEPPDGGPRDTSTSAGEAPGDEQLDASTSAEEAPDDEPRGISPSTGKPPAEFILVAVAAIELITVPRAQAKAGPRT